jgi:hypothetical protein
VRALSRRIGGILAVLSIFTGSFFISTNPRPLKVAHKPFDRDPGHRLVSMEDTLAAVVAEHA